MIKIKNVFVLAALGTALIMGGAIADQINGENLTKTLDDDFIILDETALSNATGRENLQEQASDVNQAATLGDNQLTAGNTGSNVISSSSFTDLQGIAHVIQNTGNNVIIQDSTTFNVQFVPGSVN